MANAKINKILIANRGEIACRIIKTAQQMGIECVAIYSDADKNAQHALLADEAWHVGESPAKLSYLQANKIIQIAKQSGANAIHPGYGFLSENAEFAETCEQNNIIFIGPPKSAIQAMGSKSEAKIIMQQAKVPLVYGYHGEDQTLITLQSEADKIGYPLLIKATAGGGGKGMRVVKESTEFVELLDSCKREALSSFGDDKVLIEKYLTKPRHVEIQVFADQHGNAVHLFERDCSVQRRHQKVIEEAPAPGLSEETRSEMGQVAIKAAQAIGYHGAGTVEFLYDDDSSFYFMEMNTRLQVEHPVTEKITGLDLVEWQIIVANGMALPLKQDQLKINGHAFEARIYAEDPNNNFLPTTGNISYLGLPETNNHVRVDSGIVSGDDVSIYYDPMIAKLIVWDKDRHSALARLSGALKNFHVAGIATNISFLHQLANHDVFIDADLDTHFLDKHGESLTSNIAIATPQIIAAASLEIMLSQSVSDNNYQSSGKLDFDQYSPWKEKTGWRLNEDNYHLIELEFGDQLISVTTHFRNSGFMLEFNQESYQVSGRLVGNKIYLNMDGHQSVISYAKKNNHLVLFNNASNWNFIVRDNSVATIEQDDQANLVAPMPGTVIDVLVKNGEQVEANQALIVMEAMKMEHTIKAHKDMTVNEVLYKIGDLVDEGAELISFEED